MCTALDALSHSCLCNLFLSPFPYYIFFSSSSFFLIPPHRLYSHLKNRDPSAHLIQINADRRAPTIRQSAPSTSSRAISSPPRRREKEKNAPPHYLHAQTHKQTRPTRKRDPRLLGWKTHFSTYYYYFLIFIFSSEKNQKNNNIPNLIWVFKSKMTSSPFFSQSQKKHNSAAGHV